MNDEPEEVAPPRKRGARVVLKDGTKIQLPVPALSPSAVKMFVSCPRQYWFRYIEGRKYPPGIAMLAGTSGHKALEQNNVAKMKKGQDLPVKRVVETFRDAWSDNSKAIEKMAWRNEGTTPDKVGASVEVPLTDYMKTVAPKITPVQSEQMFETTFEGVPVMGFIDLVTDDGRVHDYKVCGARSPYLKSAYADQDLQLAFYGAAMKTEKAGFIALVKGGKVARVPTLTPKSRRISVKREVVHVAKAISAGSFPKCPPGTWYCSQKWCGFHHLCRGARDGRGMEPG
jgi:putative RecB family exonuclease